MSKIKDINKATKAQLISIAQQNGGITKADERKGKDTILTMLKTRLGDKKAFNEVTFKVYLPEEAQIIQRQEASVLARKAKIAEKKAGIDDLAKVNLEKRYDAIKKEYGNSEDRDLMPTDAGEVMAGAMQALGKKRVKGVQAKAVQKRAEKRQKEKELMKLVQEAQGKEKELLDMEARNNKALLKRSLVTFLQNTKQKKESRLLNQKFLFFNLF